MIEMNEKLEKIMEETTTLEKIRLFYELAKVVTNYKEPEEYDDENL